MLTALALAGTTRKGIPTLSPIKYTSIWNDINLLAWGGMLSRDVLGYVRALRRVRVVDLSNCQPFEYQRLLCVHNGRIENFRQTPSTAP